MQTAVQKWHVLEFVHSVRECGEREASNADQVIRRRRIVVIHLVIDPINARLSPAHIPMRSTAGMIAGSSAEEAERSTKEWEAHH